MKIEGTPEQLDALRSIVIDWIGEGFTTPPYRAEVYDIFEALDIHGQPSIASYNTDRPDRAGAEVRSAPDGEAQG